MNISLPPALKQWVDEQIDHGGFGTASEYLRQLIREEQRRQTRLAIEAKLAEAEDSGEPVLVTPKTWKETDKRVAERLKAVARSAGPMARVVERPKARHELEDIGTHLWPQARL